MWRYHSQQIEFCEHDDTRIGKGGSAFASALNEEIYRFWWNALDCFDGYMKRCEPASKHVLRPSLAHRDREVAHN